MKKYTRAQNIQIPLDLHYPPALGRKEFIVAACNKNALLWIDKWPNWPSTGLAIYGSSGCGKSHLAEIWRECSRAEIINADTIKTCDTVGLASNNQALIIDRMSSDVSEKKLLHLYNLMGERKGNILFTMRKAPAHCKLKIADLSSRLAAMPAIEVGDPDDQLLREVLQKLFDDKQLNVTKEVLSYLIMRMERSFSFARAVAEEINKLALSQHRNVTVPLARSALEALQLEKHYKND